MKVSLFSNGMDHLLRKTTLSFNRDSDFSDSDVILILSAKEDKAVSALLESFINEGTSAALTIELVQTAPEKLSDALDSVITSDERHMPKAFSDLLSMLDYYNYINSVDVGYELSDRGFLLYKELLASTFAKALSEVSSALSGSDKAILFIKAPEDVWISDIDAFASALSENTYDTDISVFAVRSDTPLSFSLFINKK